MFQFGLFSTFIPYLIFAITYLGFAGNNALHKYQYFDYTGLLSQYKISDISEHNETSFIYSNHKSQSKYSNYYFEYLLKTNSHGKSSYYQSRNNHMNKFEFSKEFIKSYLFTRPPPKA